MLRLTRRAFPVASLLLATVVNAAEMGEPNRAQQLFAQMRSQQVTQPKAALATGAEALTILGQTADPGLEIEVLRLMASLQLEDGQLALAMANAAKGEEIATRLRDPAAVRSFRVLRASAYLQQGDHEQSATLAGDVLKEARAAHERTNAITALMVLGQGAAATGDFPQGIEDLHQALELSDQADDPATRQKLLSILSTFYIRTQDWAKALEFNQQSLAMAVAMGDQSRQARLFVNASMIYGNLDRPDDELQSLLKAESLAKALGNSRVLMSANVNLSDALIERKDYRGALERATLGIELARKEGDQINLATALENQGIALNRLGEHERGISAIEEGLKILQSKKSVGEEADVRRVLSEEYAFAGNYRKALEYYQSFKEESDRLYHDARAKTVQELEARYQSERQARQIAELTAQSDRRALVRNFSAVAFLLTSALGVALLGRYRLLRRSAAQSQALNHQLEELSVTDALTGLRNRRFFMDHVDQYTSVANRAHAAGGDASQPSINRDLIFFIIDLDHFKQINDQFGHRVGDAVLVEAVNRLRRAIRESDELIRWGGEEFLLVARNTDRGNATLLAERLRAAIGGPPFDLAGNGALKVSCSLGFAAYPLQVGCPQRPPWQAVVELADQALYVAKASGRNGWIGVFGAADADPEEIASAMPHGLKGLVDRGLVNVRSSFAETGSLVWDRH